jgi:large subunit ribosomal protein L30
MAKLKIRQVRSAIHRHISQKKTIRALGIRRMHQTVIHEDNPCIRGMVEKVKHLVDVEEVSE